MLEKRWYAVPPQLLTSNGQSNGQITVVDTTLFKVKQIVRVVAGVNSLELEIKRIDTNTSMALGPKGGSIDTRSDLSAFTTGLGAFIFADEQERSKVPEQAVERLTYEEEPVVARRVFQVDPLGRAFGTAANPINVTGSVSVGSLVWDEIDITRDTDGDITKAVYKLTGAPVRTLDLYYDSNKDLIEVIKT